MVSSARLIRELILVWEATDELVDFSDLTAEISEVVSGDVDCDNLAVALI